MPGSEIALAPRDEDESPPLSSAERRQLRRAWGVAGLVVLLVLGLVTAWYRITGHRAEQVAVMWTGVPECTGADVVSPSEEPVPGEESWSGPLIEAERGMRCVITVEVSNRSGGSIHLDQALLPFMGPGAGPIVKVDTTAAESVWSTPSGDDLDALRLLDVTLAPGGTTTFDIPLVFRDRGCSGGPDGGGSTWIEGFPTVTVTSLGRTLERPASSDLAFTQMDPSRGCGRMSGG